jgi:sigma-B regulation protein RsbU (phosphoserine phosphatase)
MGLRMGLARDFKIVRTVERMNRIIHRSTLTSRFVSMFYGELELNGVFIYVNAGHPAPFHLSADGTMRFMEEGGPVLGPLAEATYERGFVVMKPGDLLVFYTDGIVEAAGRESAAAADAEPATPEEYGCDRLLATARENRTKPARAVVEAIFESVEAFTGGAPPEDDRTVVVVTYPAGETVTMAFPRPQLPKG